MTYRASQPFTCASCDAGIAGEPVFHVGLPFCCAGCAAGGPCMCTYDEREEAHVSRPVAVQAVHVQAVHVQAVADDGLDAVLDEPVAVDAPSLAVAVR